MDERTTGVILRTRPLTETSLIIQWLTPNFGRLATVAKGARRLKSPFHGKLDLYYLADLSFARSRRSELHALREVRLVETHSGLRTNLHYLQQAAYCTALLEQSTEAETPLPIPFEQFQGFITFLPRQPPTPLSVLAWEMKFLEEVGLKPRLEEARMTGGSKQLMEKLLKIEWPALSRLKPSAAQIKEIDQFLHGFIIYHLGRLPPGRREALTTQDELAQANLARPTSDALE